MKADVPRRILVIDDHVETLELMGDIFADAGHETELATSVGADMADIVAARPDLVVVDLRLSPLGERLTGWDVVRLMKSHRDLRHVRILVISADAGALEEHLDEAVRMDGVQLLAKPFSLDILLAMVHDALREWDESPGGAYSDVRDRPTPPRS
ncbi:MAG TPA: response regulator [Candidatus Limnocylindria bacterium]